MALRALHKAIRVAGVLLAAALPARAHPHAGGGEIRIVADPPRLLLGSDGGAELRIAAPAGASEIAVTTNAGRIDDLQRAAGGAFTVRYRPPPDNQPQVAIVSAVARTPQGYTDGWTVIPLFGQGDAAVRTRPGAEITLRIEGSTFGPRRADENGVARIPIVVPPGVREAYHGFTPIDLKLPEPRLLHLAVDPASRADAAQDLKVRAFVVTPHGTVRHGDAPILEVSRGSVSGFSSREPGAFEAIWHLPPGPAGVERAVGRIPGSAASTAEARVETVPGLPASVAVAFDRAELVASDASEVLVTARALDAAGNPTAAALTFTADLGELGAIAETPSGAQARLRIPPRFGGRDRVEVLARVKDGSATGSRALPLRPASPAQVRWMSSLFAVAEGGGKIPLRLAVLDRFGNPVRGLKLQAAAETGEVESVTGGAGDYLLTYAARDVTNAATDAVTIDLGGLVARTEVEVVPRRDRLAVAPKLGLAWGVGQFASAYVGGAVELRTTLPARLILLAEAGYLRFAAPAAGGGTGSGECLPLLASVSYGRGALEHLQIWGSAGSGVAVVSTSGGISAAPALQAALGAGVRVQDGMPFAEARLLWIDARGAAPRLASTPVLALAAGWRFEPLHVKGRP